MEVGDMSISIEGLNDIQSGMAQKIIKNLNALKPQASEYDKKINDFIESLNSSTTKKDYFEIVQNIIVQGQSLHQSIFDSMQYIDSATMKVVKDYADKDDELKPVMNTLNYRTTFYDTIVAKKEQFCIEALKSELPADKFIQFNDFITDIKSLKPISQIIASQKNKFQQSLSDAATLDEIESIESEIALNEVALSGIYQTMVVFPDDEQTAKAVIDFLEDNHHIKSIMKSFNFREALTDDILSATARIHNTLQI
jgi:hypothetical protein